MEENETKKAGLSWNQKFFIVATVVSVVTLSLCFTLAYYSDVKRSEKSMSIGSIELDKEGSFFGTGELKMDAIPGDDMFGEISFKKVDRSSALFVRAKLEFKIDSYGQSNEFTDVEGDSEEEKAKNKAYRDFMDSWLALLNSDDVNLTTTSNEIYQWVFSKDTDAVNDEGFYYLVNPVEDDDGDYKLIKVGTTEKYYFTQGLKMPTTLEQMYESNGFVYTYQQPVYITVEIQAIHADNLGYGSDSLTITNLKPIFETAFN